MRSLGRALKLTDASIFREILPEEELDDDFEDIDHFYGQLGAFPQHTMPRRNATEF